MNVWIKSKASAKRTKEPEAKWRWAPTTLALLKQRYKKNYKSS